MKDHETQNVLLKNHRLIPWLLTFIPKSCLLDHQSFLILANHFPELKVKN